MFKIVVGGGSGVGKTSLIQRYLNRDFQPAHIITRKLCKTLVIFETSRGSIGVTFWDCGDDSFTQDDEHPYKGVTAALGLFDIMEFSTVKHVNDFVERVITVTPGTPRVLVGNKYDEVHPAALGVYQTSLAVIQTVTPMAQPVTEPFQLISAKTGHGIYLPIQTLLRRLMNDSDLVVFTSQDPATPPGAVVPRTPTVTTAVRREVQVLQAKISVAASELAALMAELKQLTERLDEC